MPDFIRNYLGLYNISLVYSARTSDFTLSIRRNFESSYSALCNVRLKVVKKKLNIEIFWLRSTDLV